MARADASHGASVVFQKNRCQRGMVTELERSVIAATVNADVPAKGKSKSK
jgi:hypothetical protein